MSLAVSFFQVRASRMHGALASALLGIATPVAAVDLAAPVITGVNEEMAANIRLHLSLSQHLSNPAVSETRLEYLLRQAPDEAREALEPFGYYDPVVSVKTGRTGNQVTVTLAIQPGEPVRVSREQIGIEGPGAEDAVLQRQRARFRPKPGEVFSQPDYEASKTGIQRVLQERGYFDAELTTHRVEVTRQTHRADVFLHWQTGPRYAFGPTRFSGSQIDTRVLERYIPWRRGQLFRQQDLVDFHQMLVDLGYFALIDIQSQPDQGKAGQVPIEVALTPAKRSLYTAGLSYGTDSGAAVRLGLERRYVNHHGHKFQAAGEWGQQRSGLAALYRIPALQWRPGWWNFGANVRQEDVGAFENTRVYEITAGRSANWKGFQFDGTGHLRHESLDKGNVTLVYPSIGASRRAANHPLYPTRGYRAEAVLNASHHAIGSDVDFLQLRVAGNWVHGWGERQRLLLRGEIGHTFIDDFEKLPPTLRFYAGGDQSVRGYGYQEISPRDAAGKAIGGKNLAVASVEVEHLFKPRWAIAGFVDAGAAFDSGKPGPRVGAGIGIRWRSPAGPVRLDVGVGLDAPEKPVQLHITLGPPL